MAKYKRKTRIWSKRRLKMPRPKTAHKDDNDDKGFALRMISEADQRFAVVRQMRARLNQLKNDAAVNSIQQEWLAARAVFIVAYLENMELKALEGTWIDYGDYLRATRALSDVLSKLGLDKEVRSAQTLSQYIVNAKAAAKANGSKA